MPASRALFATVPDKDYLGFWADQTLNAREVVDFLDLNKRDVAKLSGVAPASVRFDQKIPKEVLDRLQEIANICGLVAQFFVGDVVKTALWFKTVNPLLGNITPRDMIRYGRYEKLRRFVMEALEENAASQRTRAGDMRRNRRPRPPEAQRPLRSGEPDLPSLIELERFTQASLRQWLATKSNLDGLQRALYFELEPLRQRNEARLLEALRSQALPSLSFEGWSRILDYRYGLQPLSVAGSLKGEGGRFNIGADLSPGAFTPFPALYIAEDYEAAFRERFAAPSAQKSEGLSLQELALRVPGSFTQVRLRGRKR